MDRRWLHLELAGSRSLGKAFYEGSAFPTPYLEEMLSSGYRGEDAESIYGISVFLVDSELGRIIGHGGQYPGWRSR